MWHGEIELDSEEALSGPVELSFADGAVVWKASVHRGGSFLGRTTALLLGGAGQLGKELGPKFYEGVPLRLPLQDVLSEAGELLSGEASQDVLNFLLPKWTRFLGSAGLQILRLVEAVQNASWRVLSSGEVWMGVDTFPAFASEVTLLSEDLSRKVATFDQDLPLLFPGVSLEGKNIGRVVYDISPSRLSSRVFYE